MSKTYRVGIIGCGGMGRSHAKAYAAKETTEVVAAMDIDEEAVKRLGKEFSIPSIYTDRDEMLEKEELDIVSIPTWQIARAEVPVAVANAGIKAIIGEKPMAHSLGGAMGKRGDCSLLWRRSIQNGRLTGITCRHQAAASWWNWTQLSVSGRRRASKSAMCLS